MTRKQYLEKLREDLRTGTSAEATLSALLDALIADEEAAKALRMQRIASEKPCLI